MFWKRFTIIGSAAVAIAAGMLFHFGTADAATNPCGGGTTVGSASIKASGKVIGEVIVYKLTNNRVTNNYCVVNYHRGATYDVKLPTRIGGWSENGGGWVANENVRKYAGPHRFSYDTGCSTCRGSIGFFGEITYQGHIYQSTLVKIVA